MPNFSLNALDNPNVWGMSRYQMWGLPSDLPISPHNPDSARRNNNNMPVGQPINLNQRDGDTAGGGNDTLTALLDRLLAQARQRAEMNLAPQDPNARPQDIVGRNLPSNAIVPGAVPPISPALQNAYMLYLQSQVGRGAQPYPGQLNVNLNDTILPRVWNSWQPSAPGMSTLASMINSPQLTQPNPILLQAMMRGGFGGPGHSAMMNLINTGVAGGSGNILQQLAGGGGPTSFLSSFLRR